MPSFPLLDIAIGLAFIYLLLSLVCSSLSEGLESILRNRATDLESGIRNMLGDKPGSWWASFLPWVSSIREPSITREFYNHPLVRSLFQDEQRLPSYVPSRTFALAVMDMVTTDGNLLRGATPSSPNSALGAIATQLALNSAPGVLAFAETINGVKLPDSLKQSIDALVTAANGDAQQARINIENWFDNSMDRVSGWYKSRTQKILFCIGVVITVAVNADSITMFRNLSVSKNLESIVASAQKTAGDKLPANQDPQTQINTAMSQLMGMDIGLGWATEKEQSGNVLHAKVPPGFISQESCAALKSPCTEPIGWSFYLLYVHGIGWLITAAALSLGAPFWFDTLSRIVAVRSTTKPKEKSKDDGS